MLDEITMSLLIICAKEVTLLHQKSKGYFVYLIGKNTWFSERKVYICAEHDRQSYTITINICLCTYILCSYMYVSVYNVYAVYMSGLHCGRGGGKCVSGTEGGANVQSLGDAPQKIFYIYRARCIIIEAQSSLKMNS